MPQLFIRNQFTPAQDDAAAREADPWANTLRPLFQRDQLSDRIMIGRDTSWVIHATCSLLRRRSTRGFDRGQSLLTVIQPSWPRIAACVPASSGPSLAAQASAALGGNRFSQAPFLKTYLGEHQWRQLKQALLPPLLV
jgi:hypothetical protein